MICKQRVVVAGVEGHVAHHALVEQHARRVDVGSRIDTRLAARLLGGHVVRRAEHRALLREMVLDLVGLLADAEVEDLDRLDASHGGQDEHVVGLEIAMHDARAMRGIERIEQRQHERQRFDSETGDHAA